MSDNGSYTKHMYGEKDTDTDIPQTLRETYNKYIESLRLDDSNKIALYKELLIIKTEFLNNDTVKEESNLSVLYDLYLNHRPLFDEIAKGNKVIPNPPYKETSSGLMGMFGFGGNSITKTKYKGKTYTVKTGKRGGKYIIVGPNKDKVYIK